MFCLCRYSSLRCATKKTRRELSTQRVGRAKMLLEDMWFYEQRKTENFMNGLTRDSIVYRHFPIERFKQMLEDRQWALVKFGEWQDPFENFIYSAKATTKDGTPLSLDNLKNCVFGQSWSLHEETDALWRIYSRDKRSVKVRVRAANLFDGLYGTGENTALHLYFGKVIYKPVSDIEALMRDQKKIHDSLFRRTDGAGMIDYLLVKRIEFEHEKEARVIFHTVTDDPRNGSKFLTFSADPNSIVEEVVLDPRLNDSEASSLIDEIRGAGYAGEVRKSSLYAPPLFTLVFDL